MRRRAQAAGELGARDARIELLVAPFVGGPELVRRDVLDLLALELRRSLERDAGLVVVRVNALELWVAPRRLRRDVLRGTRGHRRCREEAESCDHPETHETSYENNTTPAMIARSPQSCQAWRISFTPY